MSTSARSSKTSARLTMLALFAVFAAPLLIASLFALGPLDWRPSKTVNHGLLLEPPLLLKSFGVTDGSGNPLEVAAVARDWFVVGLHNAACTDSCMQLMQVAERIQVAAGSDTYRVSLALLSPEEYAPVPSEQTWILPPDGKLVQELLLASGEAQLDSILLIVDYRGHIVLMYPAGEDGLGVLEDLKWLLRSAAG